MDIISIILISLFLVPIILATLYCGIGNLRSWITKMSLNIPKRLDIEDHKTVYDIVYRNADSIFTDYNSKKMLACFAELLGAIGKEIVLVKMNKKTAYDNEYIKNRSSFVNLINMANSAKNVNDYKGATKATDTAKGIFPMPESPFVEKRPVDFFPMDDSNPVVTSYHILQFLKKWNNILFYYPPKIDSYKQEGINDIQEAYNYIHFITPIPPVFINIIAFIEDLHNLGYTFGFIPIEDKNILYRPKKMAENNEYISFLYYDQFVEIEDAYKSNSYTTINTSSIVDIKKHTYVNNSGTEYVSSHYRRGHYRNGHWVSGSYVKGHFRNR